MIYSGCRIIGPIVDEELRNSHGDAGVGASYLSYSNCDGSYSNCDGIKHDALTIAKVINEAVKDSY